MKFRINVILPVLIILLLLPLIGHTDGAQKNLPLKVMTYNIRACDFGLKK